MPTVPARSRRSSLPVLREIVLRALAEGGSASRADITGRTGLSRPVVTGVLNDLLTAGDLITVDAGPRTSGRGRPATGYRLAALVPPVALVSLKSPTAPVTIDLVHPAGTSDSVELSTSWATPWQQWHPALAAGLAELEERAGMTARQVVLSAPFPVQDGRGAPELHPIGNPPGRTGPGDMRPPPPFLRPDWLISDPRPRLAEVLRRPVLLMNDANLAALGEARYGAGQGRRCILHISVLDGIGAGLVMDGKLFVGASGMAGELAHVQVVDAGPFCACGSRGCLATQALSPLVVEALTSLHHRPLTLDDVDGLVTSRDPVAIRFFNDLGALTAQASAAVVTVLEPDLLIVDSRLRAAAGVFIGGLTHGLTQRCGSRLIRGLDVIQGVLDEPIALGALAAANAAVLD